MSVELKEFDGNLVVKDKALKKNPTLEQLAIRVKAKNKGSAAIIIAGKLAELYPDNVDDYFAAKVWEYREDLPAINADFGVFCSDYFERVAVWDTNKGEPVAVTQPEDDESQNQNDDRQAEEMKSVRLLDLHSRAACLALFGPVEQITAAQYGQVVDLVNDDAGGFMRELAEALVKETRALALAPERQEQLLAWVCENTKETAQWPDIKKQLAKWIDTPADKRPQVTGNSIKENRTDSGATLGGGNQTDRSPDLVHNLSTLRIEVAIAILSMFDEIDIYSIPNKFLSPAKAMAEAEQDTRFTAWWKKLRGTPGILDYSRAAIIALIKSAPEGLWSDPVALREYINRELVESDHAHPDQKTIEAACRPKPRSIPEKKENDQTQPPVQDQTELPAVCPGRSAQLDKELNEAFEQRAPVERHTDEQPRIENLGGGVFSVDALLTADSAAPAPAESGTDTVPTQRSDAQSEESINKPLIAFLTYRQQLTIAALQGMCANPAYRGDFDDLPSMATMLVDGVLNQEGI